MNYVVPIPASTLPLMLAINMTGTLSINSYFAGAARAGNGERKI